MSRSTYADFRALDPFFDIVMKGLSGLVDGEHYFEAFGYPALPLTFRSGIKLNFGGESWRLK